MSGTKWWRCGENIRHGREGEFHVEGEYSHNIDAKGRLIIPAKFRDDLGENFVITKGMENCLYVYPEDEWNDFEKKLNALPTTTDKKARAFAYFFREAQQRRT